MLYLFSARFSFFYIQIVFSETWYTDV